MNIALPRLVIAGLAGDSGKTIVSLSLSVALREAGKKVAVFKKGPDYIDAAWLSQASGTVCRNLDTFLADKEQVLSIFGKGSDGQEIAIIEGNRGLFDSKDIDGLHSTAELAKLLQAPLLLVVDCTKATRTIAAIIKGCQEFDPELKIAGIILNKIAGKRHQKIISDSIQRYCNLKVVGAIPKLADDAEILPGRHLGLVTPAEFTNQNVLDNKLNEIAGNYLDIEEIIKIAARANSIEIADENISTSCESNLRIGYFSDSVFTFYYPENLEALEENGAKLVKISSLTDAQLPEIDALYIGGGFPETQAECLVSNKGLMISVKNAVESGLPVYAECGGLIYLCHTLTTLDNQVYQMAGVFDIDLAMNKKPVGHGYCEFEVDNDNPFLSKDQKIRGHEFHYSGLTAEIDLEQTCFKLSKGVGIGNKRDGLLYKNTLACYSHIHASGVQEWALSMIKSAKLFRQAKSTITESIESDNKEEDTIIAEFV